MNPSGFLLTLALWGAVVGGLIRLALPPGRDPMTIGKTILIGIVSSVVAGVVFRGLFQVLFNHEAGLLGSFLVATGAVYLAVRRFPDRAQPR